MASFEMVKSYSDMLNKIAIAQFLITFIMYYFLISKVPAIALVIDRAFPVSLGIELPFKISSTLSRVIVPIVCLFLSRACKLHDLLSDIFRIRYYFDIKKIIEPMVIKMGIPYSNELHQKIAKSRHVIMNNCFYKYASSDPTKQQIDATLIHSALDQWLFFWIALETEFYYIIFLFFIVYNKRFTISYLIIPFILIIYQLYSYSKSSLYAMDEVDQIIVDERRSTEIRNYINAL